MHCSNCRMRATLTKLGEGAFADVYGCQKEGWDKLAVKVYAVGDGVDNQW